MSTRASYYCISKNLKVLIEYVKSYDRLEGYLQKMLDKERVLFDYFTDTLMYLYYKYPGEYGTRCFQEEDPDITRFTMDKQQFMNFINHVYERAVEWEKESLDKSKAISDARITHSYNAIDQSLFMNYTDDKWHLTSNSYGVYGVLQLVHIFKQMDWDQQMIYVEIG